MFELRFVEYVDERVLELYVFVKLFGQFVFKIRCLRICVYKLYNELYLLMVSLEVIENFLSCC